MTPILLVAMLLTNIYLDIEVIRLKNKWFSPPPVKYEVIIHDG